MEGRMKRGIHVIHSESDVETSESSRDSDSEDLVRRKKKKQNRKRYEAKKKGTNRPRRTPSHVQKIRAITVNPRATPLTEVSA